MVDPQALRAEGLLDEIHRQREEARQARREAEAARLQAEAQGAELRRRLEGIEVERAAILEGARREAADEAQAVLDEADELRRRLARAGQPLEDVRAATQSARELVQASADPILPSRPADDLPLRVGEPFSLRSLGPGGILQDRGEREAEVQVGRLRVRASVEDLGPPRPAIGRLA